jgi:hypothetical protein
MYTKLPSFDELKAMDDHALEKLRNKLESELLTQPRRPEHTLQLIKLQSRLKYIRQSSGSVEESCYKISALMLKQTDILVFRLVELANENLIPPAINTATQQNLSAGQNRCQIIPFPNKKG